MNNYLREITIDEVLVEDYVLDISNELNFWAHKWDISDYDNEGRRRDKKYVTISIDVGSYIDLEELSEYTDLMNKMDKKFGENTAYFVGSDEDLESIYIQFDAPLKDVLGLV